MSTLQGKNKKHPVGKVNPPSGRSTPPHLRNGVQISMADGRPYIIIPTANQHGQALKNAFPRGAVSIPTSGIGLRCGTNALAASLEAQLPQFMLPLVDWKNVKDELYDLHQDVNADQFNTELQEQKRDNDNNFTLDQLAKILQLWGTNLNTTLQLGCIFQNRTCFLVPIPDIPKRVIWIMTSNDGKIKETHMEHYSGIRPHQQRLRKNGARPDPQKNNTPKKTDNTIVPDQGQATAPRWESSAEHEVPSGPETGSEQATPPGWESEQATPPGWESEQATPPGWESEQATPPGWESEQATPPGWESPAKPDAAADEKEDNSHEDAIGKTSPWEDFFILMRHGTPNQYLTLLNDVVFPGTHSEAIRTLGRGAAGGIRFRFQLMFNGLTPPTIMVQIQLRNETTIERVADVSLSLDGVSARTTLYDAVSDIDVLNNMLPAPTLPEKKLRGSQDVASTNLARKNTLEAAQLWNKDASSLTDAEHIRVHTESLVRVHIEVPEGKHSVIRYESFWDTMEDDMSPEHVMTKRSVAGLLAEVEKGPYTWSFVLPTPKNWPETWQHDLQPPRKETSLEDFMKNCQDIQDLDHGTVELVNVTRPDRPVPPAMFFTDKEHYAVTHVVAQADETHLAEIEAEMRQRTILDFAIMPLEGSRIKPEESDLDVYGIERLAEPTLFLAACRAEDEKTHVIPDIHSPVELYLNTKQTFHLSPYQILGPARHKHLSTYLFRLIKTVAAKATAYADRRAYEHKNHVRREFRSNVMDDAGRMEQEPSTDDEDDFDHTAVMFQSFVQDAAKIIVEYVAPGDVPQKFRESSPDATEDEICGTFALSIAERWWPIANKDDTLLKTILSWVSSQKNIPSLKHSESAVGEPFKGYRIAQPRGIVTDLILFVVASPLQPGWPRSFQPVHLRVEFPALKLEGSLTRMINSLLNDASNTIPGFIWCREDETTAKYACAAIRDLNGLKKESIPYFAFAFLRNFTTLPSFCRRNLLKCYPKLLERFQTGKFSGPLKEAMNALRDTPAGMVFLSGCPGAGKTGFCLEVADAVCTGGYLSAEGWKDGFHDSQAVAVQNVTATTEPKKTILERELGSVKDIGWEERIEHQPAPTNVTLSGVNTVLWVAAQNNQADDALERFAAPPYGKTCLRAYSRKRELDALFTQEARKPTLLEMSKDRFHATKLLEAHINREIVEMDAQRNPTSDPRSWSNKCKSFLHGNEWPNIQHGIAVRASDPAEWAAVKAQAMEDANKLMEKVLSEQDAVFCTAVVAAEIANHHPKFTPQLKVVDEAGRFAEPVALIPESKWPGIPTIYAGDHLQFPPIDPTHDAKIDVSFGENRLVYAQIFDQTGTSLLRRVEYMNAATVRLIHNHRAEGNVAGFVAARIYQGRMAIVKQEGTPASRKVHDWMLGITPGLQGNHLIMTIDSNETRVGNSYTNESEARLAAEIARFVVQDLQLPRSEDLRSQRNPIRAGQVLIVTPYKQQKYLIQSYIDEISDHEMHPDLVSVRTVDDSAGAEAEFVIFSLVRSSRIGFTRDLARINVALSRAKMGHITIGNKELLTSQANIFQDYMEYVKAVGGLFHVENADKFCFHCQNFGHFGETCPEQVECLICIERPALYRGHCGRKCDANTEFPYASDIFEAPHRPVDSLLRNPFKPVAGIEKGTRQKKQKAVRFRASKPKPKPKQQTSRTDRLPVSFDVPKGVSGREQGNAMLSQSPKPDDDIAVNAADDTWARSNQTETQDAGGDGCVNQW
ncbi:hypothetical protein QQS21_011207 [Conoideocrella luteorostrata]|uniref:CCHC-type domain-containing protein n=1 Tax=Conoideocrella luteorostrata TaxID=1105319 RepID=A0AAJ0CI20_9HYPO|nr:hypothetical protein QQS21_011207 [Conoideocrella luteorostrata]